MRSLPFRGMTGIKSLCLTGCLILVFLPALSVSAESDEPLTAESVSAAQADTEFTLDLYRRLAADGDDNIIVSGHSVMAAFMILAEGASGSAADQLGTTFHLPDWARQADDSRPWNFADFSQSFVELQHSMEPIGEEESAELQERLDVLQDQMEELLSEIDDANAVRRMVLLNQRNTLAEEIAMVSQQISPYQLQFANAVWCDMSFRPLPEYTSTVDRVWGAASFTCNFQEQAEEERQTINRWVAEQTADRIQDLLLPGMVTEMTSMVITNAVYFKGNWETDFDAELTENQPFYLASGEEVVVPLMADRDRTCGYVEFTPDGEINEFQRTADGWQLPENPDGFKMLELPYRGGQLSMMIVLPNQQDGLSQLEAQLDLETLSSWKEQMRQREVEVYLPRFEVTRKYTLNDTMKALGIPLVFEPGGLTLLSGSPALQVSVVQHKAFIEVNEQGTEAAAATAITLLEGAAAPQPTPQFRADHPFLYYIQDRDTGAILFMGRLSVPETAE